MATEIGTPSITPHALARCAEMGISTKVAKRIVQNPSMTWPGSGVGRMFIRSDLHPEYAVVLDVEGHAVITVVFVTHEDYDRNGTTFIPKGGAR